MKFQGIPVRPGDTHFRRSAAQRAGENCTRPSEGIGFPQTQLRSSLSRAVSIRRKSWPVLVVFSTSDSQRENRGDIPFDLTAALSENWLILTGDGPERPHDDSTGWRAAMTLAALDALHRSFPGSNEWPVACAGISGGAKRACLDRASPRSDRQPRCRYLSGRR